MAADALAAGPPLVPRRQPTPRQLLGEGGVSLALHLLVAALLALTLARHRQPDFTAPTEVAVVFDGGPKIPAPQTEESRHSAPSSAPDRNSTEEANGGAPATPPAQQAAPAPPVPVAAPSVPAIPPSAVIPAVPAGPGLVLPPGLVERPAVPRIRVSRAPPVRTQPRSGNPFASLSSPMVMSLTGRPPPPASEGRLKRGILLSMAPNDTNRNVMTRFAEIRRKLGDDWAALFSAFVEAHKYYPAGSGEAGEDGTVTLHLWISRDGTVQNVKIVTSSGYARLDASFLSLFRGNKLPPFPPGTIEDKVDFDATMQFILIRE